LKLLVDQNLPRALAAKLHAAGHDVSHTEDVGFAKALDPQLMEWCCANGRVLITADKKLTKFLASAAATCPSVVITRDLRTMRVDDLARLLVANLPQIAEAIDQHGHAVFVLASGKPVRAQLLPLGPQVKPDQGDTRPT
jgi:predicted nuclease of predicted toxin-antitoxin system